MGPASRMVHDGIGIPAYSSHNDLIDRADKAELCLPHRSIAAKTTSDEKLKLAVQKLVDVDTIMNTMPNAIKNTCKMAM